MNDESARLHKDITSRIPKTLSYLAGYGESRRVVTKEDDMEPEDFDQLSDAEKFAHIKSLIIDLGPAYYERVHQGLKSIYDAEEAAKPAPDDDKDAPFSDDVSPIYPESHPIFEQDPVFDEGSVHDPEKVATSCDLEDDKAPL